MGLEFMAMGSMYEPTEHSKKYKIFRNFQSLMFLILKHGYIDLLERGSR